MGRRRLHNDPREPLPPGLHKCGRQFRARRSSAHPWVFFGADYVQALPSFGVWKRANGAERDVSWLLDLFVGHVCQGKVRAKQLKERTPRDYFRDATVLKAGLGHIPLSALKAKHVTDYRDARVQSAPGHVRNEMACLPAAMAYAVEKSMIASNPCLKVQRPSRQRRMRLVSDDEYLLVYKRATRSVQIAMTLGIRTLALPEDILQMGPANVLKLPDGTRILRFQRGKTGNLVEIELVSDLARVVDEHLVAPVVHATFVHKKKGGPYAVDGIGAMFRRYCVGSKKRPTNPQVKDFGLRDLRAKGATDEYHAGRLLRSLQHLLGHRSQSTSEIYLKSLVPERVRPNERPIIATASE